MKGMRSNILEEPNTAHTTPVKLMKVPKANPWSLSLTKAIEVNNAQQR
jgi:hypothetical protein